MADHYFYLKANWPGGRNNTGSINTGQLQTQISIPPEMNGPGEGTNPDEMLLGAAATCYIITLAAMIERAELPLKEMAMDSEGVVNVTNGVMTYKKIIHKPYIALKDNADQTAYEKLNDLVEKAESSCMISRAIKGNVTIELQANIE